MSTDTIKNLFSTVLLKKRNDGWIELSYDDVIRVMTPRRPNVAGAAAAPPLGEQLPGSFRLQGEGIISLSCTTPDCVKGIPPVQKAPDLAAFWMEIQMTSEIQAPANDQPRLVGSVSGSQISIPIFEMSLGTDQTLCHELKKYRQRAGVIGRVAYHVYAITDAPAELAALRNKRIALPIPSEQVVAAADLARVRSSA